MKFDSNGLQDLKSTIETPFQALAEQLSNKNCLDKQTSEIVSFIFENLAKIGEEPWDVTNG